MADTIKIQVPGRPEYVSTIRLAISSLANKAGFDIEAIEDIKVAISEACSNIILHSTIGEDCHYMVVCEISDDRFVVQVEDDGVGFDASEIVTPDLDEYTKKANGLGIFIIRTLMDEVEVASQPGKGTLIRMIKNRQML